MHLKFSWGFRNVNLKLEVPKLSLNMWNIFVILSFKFIPKSECDRNKIKKEKIW